MSLDRVPKVLFLPSLAWRGNLRAHVPGSAPDPSLLFDRLAEAGFRSEILDPHAWPWNPMANKGSFYRGIDFLRAIEVATRHRDADIAVSVFEGGALPLCLARRLLPRRLALVLWDIGLTDGWPLRQRLQDFLVPRVDAVLVLESSQKTFAERHWRTGAMVDCVGHSVDTVFFSPTPIPADGPILSVGDDAGRDFSTLSAACAGLDIDLVVRSGRAGLAEALPPNARMIGGRLDFPAFRQLYASCRLVVVATHVTLNACGISSLLEAYAMGRPVVASRNPALGDFLVEGETCLTVPPGDPAALAAAIRRVLSDPGLAVRLAAGGRRLVEDRCAIPVFADRLAQSFRRLLARRAGP